MNGFAAPTIPNCSAQHDEVRVIKCYRGESPQPVWASQSGPRSAVSSSSGKCAGKPKSTSDNDVDG
jgi:hypothetical protein